MRKVSRVVAGVSLELVEGIRYRASRPFATRGRTVYPVTIETIDVDWSKVCDLPECQRFPNRCDHVGVDVETVTVDDLTYDAANDLVNAFNNGASSFDGRIW